MNIFELFEYLWFFVVCRARRGYLLVTYICEGGGCVKVFKRMPCKRVPKGAITYCQTIGRFFFLLRYWHNIHIQQYIARKHEISKQTRTFCVCTEEINIFKYIYNACFGRSDGVVGGGECL